MARLRTCIECGVKFEVHPKAGEFCTKPCRKKFHNRRAKRGAQLYDIFMSMRFARGQHPDDWTLLCALGARFREADKALRNGRRSWQAHAKALDRIPYGYGSNGDNR